MVHALGISLYQRCYHMCGSAQRVVCRRKELCLEFVIHEGVMFCCSLLAVFVCVCGDGS